MSANRVNLAEGISAFQMDIGLSSITGISAIAGQVGLVLEYVSGGTLELGGASLTWGEGFVIGTTLVTTHEVLPVSGTVYVAATGATVALHGYKLYSEGNPGNAG